MARRGWKPEDFYRIKPAIVEEDVTMSRDFLNQSFSSKTTSVFEEEEAGEDSQPIKSHGDGKQSAFRRF